MSEGVTARQMAEQVRQTSATLGCTHIGLLRNGEMVALFTPDEFEEAFAEVPLEPLCGESPAPQEET